MGRCYLLFNSVADCQQAVEKLAAAGISEQRLHTFASISESIDALPKASIWQRTELARGILLGVLVGGLAGFCGGLLVINYPPVGLQPDDSILLLMTLFGALFALLVNMLTKSRQHNHRLDRFKRDLAAGHVLLLAKLPSAKRDNLLNQLSEDLPTMQIKL
ncbi:MAG: hypothetical protein MI754_12225 [Chromatiales bacterium]|nr:hypothetical protein [Chromatiales bacterium]